MRILFDHGPPVPLRTALAGHVVKTAFECGWQTLANGELQFAAEADEFDVFVTTDQNLRYQQNSTQSSIAIVVLSTTNWRRIRLHLQLVVEALASIAPGAFVEVLIP